MQKAVLETRPTVSDGTCSPASLAAKLRQSLSPEAEVAVYWRDPDGDVGCSITEGAGPLMPVAAQVLRGGERDATPPALLVDAWCEPDGTQAVLVVSLAEPWGDALTAAWMGLARHVVCAALVAARARAQVEKLRQSERLQHALYEIADLAGSDLELADMLRRIHGIVGELMYAENFYIVSYDAARERMRFLYFADQRDAYVADPRQEIGPEDLPHSLTLALLRHGAPLRGSTEAIRGQIGLDLEDSQARAEATATAGPESLDWLGVPVIREDRVCGALVVQSYDRPECYTDEDRALLAFVAQHIQTALDRHQAREELERRVLERTEALCKSNRDLQTEIVERQRAEHLQRALFRIAELSITAETLERFYSQVHDVVGELLYARNFYIALLSSDGRKLQFPYSVDEREVKRETRDRASGLSEYVIERGVPLLADRARIVGLEAEGVRSLGVLSHCWLGVPLRRDEEVVGCIAVQSYSPAVSFTLRDQELLMFVAHHIGIGLARKQAQDRLVAAHAELEQRVTSRTHELAEANSRLIAQIGERVKVEKQLTHQALHDPLTQLPNRIPLLKRLDAAIERARVDDGHRFAVLFLDLDRFKLINDSAGHAAGDKLLVEVSRRIVHAVRSHDTVARLGGDEFAVVIEDIEGPRAAEELAARMIEVLGDSCWVAGRELFPSASIGIAMWHPRYQDGAEMLRDADAAMYRAKASGRSDWAVFDEAMREDAMRILDLEADLRRAINGSGFIAFYQPIVRLSDGKVVGHEALLRWRHERRGLLAPGEFIGLGEDSGLIEEVDWLVYEQVAHRLARTSDGYISVNVSPRHFRSDDFADRLLDLLAYAGADPRRLRIEITEVALLDDAPRTLRMLLQLRDKGVLAQLDDFGTGFSALSYLHRFPIECLKIDRSFVAGLIGESRAESIAVVRAIQALANALGIHTVGEGIETEAQREILAGLGCSHGQGFLFGHSSEHPSCVHPMLEAVEP